MARKGEALHAAEVALALGDTKLARKLPMHLQVGLVCGAHRRAGAHQYITGFARELFGSRLPAGLPTALDSTDALRTQRRMQRGVVDARAYLAVMRWRYNVMLRADAVAIAEALHDSGVKLYRSKRARIVYGTSPVLECDPNAYSKAYRSQFGGAKWTNAAVHVVRFPNADVAVVHPVNGSARYYDLTVWRRTGELVAASLQHTGVGRAI